MKIFVSTTLSILSCFALVFSGCSTNEDGVAGPSLQDIFSNEVTVEDTSNSNNAIDVSRADDLPDVPELNDKGGESGDTSSTAFKPCDENSDCDSELCIVTMEGSICTEACVDTCPDGFVCRTLAGTDPVTICLPKHVSLCFPCNTHSDCANIQGALIPYEDARCIPDEAGKGSFCGGGCESNKDCPETYECTEVEVDDTKVSQCTPKSGECTCSPLAETLGAKTECANTSDFGTCTGEITCSNGELTQCNAATAEEEICDGIDNNCNGAKDEKTCADDNPCTIDECLGADGCKTPAVIQIGLSCDDQDAETENDVCDGKGECHGTPINCPNDECAKSAPTSGNCNTTYEPKDTPCNDNNPASVKDVCDGQGNCAGIISTCGDNQIEGAEQCDGGPCCTANCTFQPNTHACRPAVSDCDVAELCSGTETTCPADSFSSQGAQCTDSDNTTKNDICDGQGACKGTSFECDKPTQCIESFSQDGSTCVPKYVAKDTKCNDKLSNTKNDTCNGFGKCTGTEYTCKPGTKCTPGYTQDGTDCVPKYAKTGTQCDDGKEATKDDTCDGAGTCKGTPLDCPKTTACITEYKKDGTTCVPQYANEGTNCNDQKNNTKDDKCNAAGLCVGVPYTCKAPPACVLNYTQNGTDCMPEYADNTTVCNDQNNSTKNDKCNGAGTCTGTQYNCNDKPKDVCIESYTTDGVGCVPNYAAPDTKCDDKNSSTKNDKCNGKGVCKGSQFACGNPPVCVDSYTQNGAECVPKYSSKSTNCDDNDNNTKNDKCNGAGQCAGTKYNCNNKPTDICTPSYSEDGTNCVPNYANSNTQCDDNDNSTKNDKCNGKGVCKGSPYNCKQPPVCVNSYTQNGSDCVPQYSNSSTLCNDNNNTTKNDKCNGAGTCQGTPYSCSGGNSCIQSYTQNGVDCTPNPKKFGAPCDDNNEGTYSDQCNGSGTCKGKPCDVSTVITDNYGNTWKTNMMLIYSQKPQPTNVALIQSVNKSYPIFANVADTYTSKFGRPADQGGFNYWVHTDYKKRCEDTAGCSNYLTGPVHPDAWATTLNAMLSSYNSVEAQYGQLNMIKTLCEAKELGY